MPSQWLRVSASLKLPTFPQVLSIFRLSQEYPELVALVFEPPSSCSDAQANRVERVQAMTNEQM
jgi:hypothetical protein